MKDCKIVSQYPKGYDLESTSHELLAWTLFEEVTFESFKQRVMETEGHFGGPFNEIGAPLAGAELDYLIIGIVWMMCRGYAFPWKRSIT